MCNFDTPQLLYFSYVPTLVAAAILGSFVLFADSKAKANRNFFYFVLAYILWSAVQLLTWIVKEPQDNLFVTRLGVLGAFSVLYFFYFINDFLGHGLSWKRKLLHTAPFLPILALVQTNWNAAISDASRCVNVPGPLYILVYVLVVFYTIKIFYIVIKERKKYNERLRKQIRIIAIAFLTFITWIVGFSLVAALMQNTKPGIADNVSVFIPAGAIFFIGFTAYAIERYKAFNTKIVLTQIAVAVLWVLIGSQFFVTNAKARIPVLSLVFGGMVIFGLILIKSVQREIRRREQIQSLSTELASANKKLKSLDGLKTEFLSIATHQLRTPLTGIKGYVSMMADGDFGEVKPEQKKILESVLENTEKLVKLIADFLDISRIERGKLEINKQPTDVMHMMESIYDIFKPAAAAKNLQLMYHPPTNPVPATLLDEEKFRQVILNIVDNAIKYTPNGRIDLYFTDEGDHFRFESRDTGVGMTQEDISRLFQRFSRAKDAFKTSTTGTGLGMYVAKKVVESHAGKIWAESRGKDQGSSWFVEIPYDQSRTVTAELSPEEKEAQEASTATEKIAERLKNIDSK